MENQITKLKNNIEFFYKRNLDTPRSAVCLNFAIKDYGMAPGVYSLMARLLFQGTKTRTAAQIAEEFDSSGIDFVVEMKMDYLRFRFLCLNEDFERALELVTDLVKNSTFEEFEKEKAKLEGELVAELDSPRQKVTDAFTKNIFTGHSYGVSNTIVLENLSGVTKEQVIDSYNELFNNSKKIITFVGDIDFDKVEKVLDKNWADIPEGVEATEKALPAPLLENKEVTITKPDAN